MYREQHVACKLRVERACLRARHPVIMNQETDEENNAMQLYLDNIFIVESAARFGLLLFTNRLQAQAKNIH